MGKFSNRSDNNQMQAEEGEEIEESINEENYRQSESKNNQSNNIDMTDSVGSSGNFGGLFEGQPLSAEEQALLRELKQREKEQLKDGSALQTAFNQLNRSPSDYADDDDDEDEDDEYSPQKHH